MGEWQEAKTSPSSTKNPLGTNRHNMTRCVNEYFLHENKSTNSLFLEINECSAGTDNCDANADCTNTVGSYNCTCKSGYSGDGVTCTGTLLSQNSSIFM